jgi:predicted transcriptional regulator
MHIDTISGIIELNRLIEQEKTGGPAELAAKIGITRQNVFSFIRFMKSEGELIRFDRKRKTYYYVTNYSAN